MALLVPLLAGRRALLLDLQRAELIGEAPGHVVVRADHLTGYPFRVLKVALGLPCSEPIAFRQWRLLHG
jgi:hypothetical protein